jgi:CRISPR-associated protein Csm5
MSLGELDLGKSKKWEVRVVTPLHVGLGEDIRTFEYFYDKKEGKLIVFDLERLLENQGLDEKIIEEFISQMGGTRFNIFNFLNSKKVPLKDMELYRVTCPVQPKGNVRAAIKHLSTHPYLPGTTLKGAIRTAVLWKLLKDQPDEQDFAWKYLEPIALARQVTKKKTSHLQALKDVLNIDEDEAKKVLKELYNLFGKRLSTPDKTQLAQKIERRPKLLGPDTYLDVMRSLHVYDSFPLDPSQLKVYQVEVYERVDKTFQLVQRGNRPILLFIEAFPPETILSINIKFDKFLFSEKAESELSFGDRRANVDPDQQLLSICNQFSKELLGKEADFYSKGNGKFKEIANWCLEKAKEVENLKGECLLPIGWGTGWFGKTFGRLIQEKKSDLFISLAKAYDLGKGNRLNFPISRKIVMESGRYLPMGWVRLKPDNS